MYQFSSLLMNVLIFDMCVLIIDMCVLIFDMNVLIFDMCVLIFDTCVLIFDMCTRPIPSINCSHERILICVHPQIEVLVSIAVTN